MAEPIDLTVLKAFWLQALEEAEQFIRERPAEELGCLYYSTTKGAFIAPSKANASCSDEGIIPHYGQPGGVLPRFNVQR